MDDEKVWQSYVYYKGQCWFVSTIERDSSAMVGPPAPRFHETTVWEYDEENGKRKGLVWQGGEYDSHIEACRSLTRFGTLPDEDVPF